MCPLIRITKLIAFFLLSDFYACLDAVWTRSTKMATIGEGIRKKGQEKRDLKFETNAWKFYIAGIIYIFIRLFFTVFTFSRRKRILG